VRLHGQIPRAEIRIGRSNMMHALYLESLGMTKRPKFGGVSYLDTVLFCEFESNAYNASNVLNMEQRRYA